MSYVSLLKNIPEFLSQPTGIAALASFGLHGAIAVLMPLMSISSPTTAKPETDLSKSVGLVELSPEAQSRLPEMVQPSQFSLQPYRLPQQQNLPPISYGSTILPPLSGSTLPPIPATSLNSKLSSVPQSSNRVAVNSTPPQFGRSSVNLNFSGRNSRNVTRGSIIPSGDRFTRGGNPYPLKPDLGIPQINQSEVPEFQPNPPISDPLISSQPLTSPSSSKYDSGLIPTDIPPTNTNEGFNPNGRAGLGNLAANDNNGNSNVTTPQNGEKVDLNNSGANSDNSQPQSRAEDKKNPETKLAQQTKSFDQLRNEIKQAYPGVKEKEPIRATIPTDKTGVEGTVLGRVVVEPDGKVSDLRFQDGTISPALKLKVREFFRTNPRKTDQKNTSTYSFQISFKRQENNSNEGNSQPQPKPNSPEPTSTENQEKPKPTSPEQASTENQEKPKPTSPEQASTEDQGKPKPNNNVVANPTPTPNNIQPEKPQESTPEFIQKLRDTKSQGSNSEE